MVYYCSFRQRPHKFKWEFLKRNQIAASFFDISKMLLCSPFKHVTSIPIEDNIMLGDTFELNAKEKTVLHS